MCRPVVLFLLKIDFQSFPMATDKKLVSLSRQNLKTGVSLSANYRQNMTFPYAKKIIHVNQQ